MVHFLRLIVESILIHPSITSDNTLCSGLLLLQHVSRVDASEINALACPRVMSSDGIAVAVLHKRTTHDQESPAVASSLAVNLSYKI